MAAAKQKTAKGAIACLAVTDGGHRLAALIATGLGGEHIGRRRGLAELLPDLWQRCEGLVFVMATGIVVRLIAPLLVDKASDPAVVVIDEAKEHAISLLSGHLGGANELARRVAALTGARAVITTASDLLGHTALDLWAREHGLFAANRTALTRASAQLVNAGRLRIYSEVSLPPLPCDLVAVTSPEAAECIVSYRQESWPADSLLLVPRRLVLGIGCNRGTGIKQIEAAVRDCLRQHRLAPQAVARIASIDLKHDEAGLLAFAAAWGLQIDFFDKEALNAVTGPARSEAVFRATGAWAVAEPAALLGSGADNLLIGKMKWQDVTVAVAEAPSLLSAPDPAA